MLVQRPLLAAVAGALVATFLTSGNAEPQTPPPASPPQGTTGADSGKSAGGPEAAFNNACRTCHSLKPDDNRLGPSLAGITGKKAGQSKGFAYSQSLKNSGVTWDAATLEKFITNPDDVVPGNAMKPYTGISDAAVRAEIIKAMQGS